MTKKYQSVQVLNQFINVFWTIFAFIPIFWLWATVGINHWFYTILGIAALFLLMPQKMLTQFKLRKSRKAYEKMGVKFIRKLAQDGDLVKSLSNATSPSKINNRIQAQKYLSTIAMYERFHWLCFIFFTGSAVYAFVCEFIWMGIWIILANIVYNLSSIMLQQYNRLRLGFLQKN